MLFLPILCPSSASFVETELGRKIRLHGKDRTQREAIAKQLLTPGVGVDANAPNKKVGTLKAQLGLG